MGIVPVPKVSIMNVNQGEGESQVPSKWLTLRDVQALDERAALGRPMLALRQEALTRFLSLPFPATNHELWRHTKTDLFDWEGLRNSSVVDFKLGLTESGSASAASTETLTSALPEGVTLSVDFSAYASQLGELFGERALDLVENSPAQMLLAAASAGCVVHVAKGRKIKEPLLLSQVVKAASTSAAPLIVVLVEPNASVTIVEDIELGVWAGLYAPRVEVVIQANASMEFVSIQRLSNAATYLGRHRFHLLRDASVRSIHVALGAKTARLDLDCKLYEPGGQADMFSLYLGAGGRHVDFHPTQWHLAPHCRSNLYCKGALKDVSRSVYFGYIRVAEAAQKTDAYQTNRNLLLSPDARADAIPNLEIKANDVKCSHGASIGQVGAEELFYLMSRGLPRAASEKLLVEGFFADLMGKISSQFARDVVDRVVMEQLYA